MAIFVGEHENDGNANVKVVTDSWEEGKCMENEYQTR